MLHLLDWFSNTCEWYLQISFTQYMNLHQNLGFFLNCQVQSQTCTQKVKLNLSIDILKAIDISNHVMVFFLQIFEYNFF